MDDSPTYYGEGMSQEEITAFLEEVGTGVLALAGGNEAYSIPISFGYDGDERVYFTFFAADDKGMKHDFASLTEVASLSVPNIQSRSDWQSVTVRGPIRRIDGTEWETLRAAINDNAWHPHLGSTYKERSVEGYAMQIEEVSGVRTTSEPTEE